MRAAGIRELGGPVQLLELPGPRGLGADEVRHEAPGSLGARAERGQPGSLILLSQRS